MSSRRGFLQNAALGALGLSLPHYLQLDAAAQSARPGDGREPQRDRRARGPFDLRRNALSASPGHGHDLAGLECHIGESEKVTI